MKKPEEYLEEQVVAPDEGSTRQLSSMEQEFIKKYLTGEEELDSKPVEKVDTAFSLQTPQPGESAGPDKSPEPGESEVQGKTPEPEKIEEPEEAPEPEETGSQEETPGEVEEETKKRDKTDDSGKETEESDTKSREKVQLVGFYLQNQEYTIPISDVKEVIKRIEPTEIPESPEYLLGVVNLKGKVTPLINLAYLLGNTDFDTSKCGFIIIGHYQDLQVGILVDRITTMHNIEQKDIDWTLDPYLTGGGKEFLTGLIRGDPLIGIISIKEIVDKIMQ